MTQRQIQPPANLAVSLSSARDSLRVDGTDLDALITLWLQGITAAMEHEIGQSIITQTWQVKLDAFPGAITLPHPVISISALEYVDAAGNPQTLAPSAYKIKRDEFASYLLPVAGTAWPSTLVDSGVVTVTLLCGYGPTDVTTPPPVRLYILAKLVEQFDPATRLERDTVQSSYVGRLLDSCRTYA
jgi:uncharacterized phiE125 gp8 family phage protein